MSGPETKMATRKNTKKGSPGLYTKARDERRRAERDEQLLANRIALLKQEEAKARRRRWRQEEAKGRRWQCSQG